MSFEEELAVQKKELEKINDSYDKWEENLNEAELLLFKYQDIIESYNKDDLNVDQLIQDLESNYATLSNEISTLEEKYNLQDESQEKASIVEAEEVLKLLRKLNSDIDMLNESPYMKSINSKIAQLRLISDVLT
ncbi:hypothetical protein M9Y10_035211 [Tritrichomonas musculus]|uniref:Uncharacterized protein n=1 Tax=Tritrichomonas musculus TaxID=1915356 RepID=A0ABR2KKC1_9EUKA